MENLSKTYGKGENKVVAIDNVSFSVQKGEFVAIVGASGSGKSTLLHLIGGVDRPTSGKVFIDGKDIYQMSDDNLAIFRRRQVGLIYQFYNLIPILNVEENITLPCDLDNKKVDKQKLDVLLKNLGLDARRKHLPNELSGGQQQRTSIGRAIITNPSIILADEPTGNLDSKASEEIVNLLKNMVGRARPDTYALSSFHCKRLRFFSALRPALARNLTCSGKRSNANVRLSTN